MEVIEVVTLLKLVGVFFVIGMLSGCSLKIETGYHGKTGRDDNTVTESFRTGKGGRY